jgi:hypothetical protein
VAYDLLFHRQVPGNWAIKLVDYEFAPEPTLATPEEQAFVAKLAVIKMAADAGNKKKLKEWRATQAKLALVRKRAAAGDETAKHLVAVLNESGLFAGAVQSMSIDS